MLQLLIWVAAPYDGFKIGKCYMSNVGHWTISDIRLSATSGANPKPNTVPPLGEGHGEEIKQRFVVILTSVPGSDISFLLTAYQIPRCPQYSEKDSVAPLGELMSTSLKAIYPLSCKLATFSIGFCKEIQWHSIGVIMVPSASIARTGLSLSLTLVKPYRRSIHACSMHNFSLGRVFGGRIRDAYSRTEKNFVVNEPGTVITRFFIYLPWEIPRMTIRCRRCSLRTWICDGALLNAASDDLLQTLISRLGFHSASKSGQYPFREHCWEAGRNRTFIVKVPMI